uniref:Uncharacterized protein n=1 Tax=Panagrolaimus superbus TaxID=310955 RepID=A0A914Z0W4_9BILA
MVGQERGSENTFSVLLDDMIELGHDYTFTDCNIRDSAAPAPSTSYASNSADPPSSTERGTPTTPPRATFARPPATPTTPTTSRPTFERYRETPTTLTSAPSTPTHASDGRTAVFIPVSFDSVSSPTALPMSANNTPTSSHLLPKS